MHKKPRRQSRELPCHLPDQKTKSFIIASTSIIDVQGGSQSLNVGHESKSPSKKLVLHGGRARFCTTSKLEMLSKVRRLAVLFPTLEVSGV